MKNSITLFIIVGLLLVALFGATAIATNCQMTVMHQAAGMSSCPNMVASIFHHLNVFILLFSAVFATAVLFFIILRVAFDSIPGKNVLEVLFRNYQMNHRGVIIYSLPQHLFSQGILHRKDALIIIY